MNYLAMSREQLSAEYAALLSQYARYRDEELVLDLSRGKPCAEQLDYSTELLSVLQTPADCLSEGGFDCRNYGLPFGLPEARRFFSRYTGVAEEQIIVCGNSSLNLMYDAVARCMLYGTVGSERPWCREPHLKFLCPSPGYDRHFAITQSLGFDLVTVDMTEDGPDMEQVEALVRDPAVKGIWCVPKYANPTGISYSEETVRRLASMRTAAPDFRIFWDNAYAVHAFEGDGEELTDIFAAAQEAGHADRIFYFTSTSKITFPGAGIAMIAASPANLKQIGEIMSVQTIGHDKLNQLRHVRLLGDEAALGAQMARHAAVVHRKFDILFGILRRDLSDAAIARWSEPAGGYFSSLDLPDGCARRVYELCRDAGVALTAAGATFPYGVDPRDRNLRLAPTYAKDKDLAKAAEILCCAAKLAAAEKLLKQA